MIPPVLFVYSLVSVCAILKCSAGNPGSTSDGDNVAKLNDILKSTGWNELITQALHRELKYANGQRMDVSDLLSKGSDGSIVTPANYTDKLLKSATAVNCFYGDNIKCINEFFVEIIAGKCTGLGSAELHLDCMERFWQTMHMNKSLMEKMLVVLNFYHKASNGKCARTVTDALEYLLPHYDRRSVYNKANYLDGTGAVKMDDFKRDYEFFLDNVKCANKIMQDFLLARCLPSCDGEDTLSEGIRTIQEALDNHPAHPTIDEIFDLYVDTLQENETIFITNLGFDGQL